MKSVFPACRFYREDAAPDKSEKPASDWTNMVMFCRKSKDYFSFREAVDADFLGSQTRRYELQPKHEINAALLDGKSNDGFPEISRRGNIKFIEALHQNSAVGHWKIMRTVLPDVIWQNW